MATNWYDPSGSNAGFYNSPQDFLFKSSGGTWYGQGASGQDDAAKMPTMGDFYFGAPQQSSYYDQQRQQMAQPIRQVASPEGPMGAPAPMSRMGGGGSINLGDNVSVPQGPLWQRYQAVQANPEMITADPAFQFLQQQGEQALGRSAGARRKRFAGQTMLDFQKQGQGQAANYLRTLLPELRAGAGQEYEVNRRNVLGKRTEATMQALQSDPYGHARNLASQFRTLQEYMASPAYAASARAGRGEQALALYRRGQELNKSIWGG